MNRICFDTNVIVRLLTNDDPDQANRAKILISQNSCFLTKTVLLETIWVLSFSYKFDRQQIVRAIRKMLGLSTLNAEEPQKIEVALDWYEKGMDPADAIHLLACTGTEWMATFDKAFSRKANALNTPMVKLI